MSFKDPVVRHAVLTLVGILIAISGFLARYAFNEFSSKLDKVYDFSISGPKDIQRIDERQKEDRERFERKINYYDGVINSLITADEYVDKRNNVKSKVDS